LAFVTVLVEVIAAIRYGVCRRRGVLIGCHKSWCHRGSLVSWSWNPWTGFGAVCSYRGRLIVEIALRRGDRPPRFWCAGREFLSRLFFAYVARNKPNRNQRSEPSPSAKSPFTGTRDRIHDASVAGSRGIRVRYWESRLTCSPSACPASTTSTPPSSEAATFWCRLTSLVADRTRTSF